MMLNEGKCCLIFGNEINVLTGPQMINSVQLKKIIFQQIGELAALRYLDPSPRLMMTTN